jgi:hypothetical protein
MSYSVPFLPKFVSLMAAMVVTVGVQAALLAGFNQMANPSAQAVVASQTSASLPRVTVVHARG